MCTNLSVISIHLNTVKNLLTLFWNSLDLGWEAGILFESCRHGKLESQLKNVNNLLFFLLLPLGFLAAQGQHDNCSSLGRMVAFFTVSFHRVWRWVVQGETRVSAAHVLLFSKYRFPSKNTSRETRPGLPSHPSPTKAPLTTSGSFGCRWCVLQGGFIPGLTPECSVKPTVILSRQGEGSSSSLQLSDKSEGKKHVIEAFYFFFCYFTILLLLLLFECPDHPVMSLFANSVWGKTACSLPAALCEACSRTPYSGRALGFCCGIFLPLLSKDWNLGSVSASRHLH